MATTVVVIPDTHREHVGFARGFPARWLWLLGDCPISHAGEPASFAVEWNTLSPTKCRSLAHAVLSGPARIHSASRRQPGATEGQQPPWYDTADTGERLVFISRFMHVTGLLLRRRVRFLAFRRTCICTQAQSVQTPDQVNTRSYWRKALPAVFLPPPPSLL